MCIVDERQEILVAFESDVSVAQFDEDVVCISTVEFDGVEVGQVIVVALDQPRHVIHTLSLQHLLDSVNKTQFLGDSTYDEVAIGNLLCKGIDAIGVVGEGQVEEDVESDQTYHCDQENKIDGASKAIIVDKLLKS